MAETADNNQKGVVKEAVRQFVDASLRGEKPDLDEFIKQYPGLESQIRKGIQELHKINNLFDSLAQADQSDFEDITDEYDLVGKNVGSFEIVKIIGRGGMGVVYLANDTKLKRSVAIKSIPAALTGDSTTRKRFRREAELLASLNHPNIAVIHEIVEEEKSGYLILEHVAGETLAERIAREPLKLKEALSIGRQVAEAISSAHKKGIIHRDLKPGNIKITPDGQVKVLDFGLAKASVGEGRSVENTVTQPGRVIGTPAYMSPEQARGKQTDERSDIWSFGCIMYQMLTGHLPFEGETATDTLAHIIERQPDWDVLPENTPMNIRVLLRRCLEKNPQQRLGDITNVALEIRETLNASVLVVPTKSRKVAMIFGAVIIIVLSAIAMRFIPQQQALPTSKEIRLVVLPFENLGSTEDEYFADGITDAITARLAGIHGLGVISRQSAMQYKNKEIGIKQIAQELSVDYILEGTIQRERPTDPTSRVRIIPQLINASKDTHVWTEIYDDDMSEVFRLQSDVAEQVAQALDIALIEPERRALESKPTENTEAYEYYLRGNEYLHRNDYRIAMRMYEKAVELDPAFAVAYARLSGLHTYKYLNYSDRSEERLAMAKQAVDNAFKLDPELPEAHVALGAYYSSYFDNDRALEQFNIVRNSQPNNSEIFARIGGVQRRQGKFELALTNLKKASELNPLSLFALEQLGNTFVRLRMYSEAERCFNRAILLAPDRFGPYQNKAWLYLTWEGNTEKTRVVVAEALQNIKSTEILAYVHHLLVAFNEIDRNYQEALDCLSLKSEYKDNMALFIPRSLQCARIYMYMDEKELAKKYYDDARSILESKIKEQPGDARFHSSLGIAYAGLGLKDDAIREGKLGVELRPVTKDAVIGTMRVENLARILVMVDEYDAAIDQIEFLLSNPGWMSITFLRLDPAWDPLHNHPRFKKLIDESK